MICKLQETECGASEDNKQDENYESELHNIENEDNACGCLVYDGKQLEPLFLLNTDRGPELESVVQIFTECFPNGDIGWKLTLI